MNSDPQKLATELGWEGGRGGLFFSSSSFSCFRIIYYVNSLGVLIGKITRGMLGFVGGGGVSFNFMFYFNVVVVYVVVYVVVVYEVSLSGV